MTLPTYIQAWITDFAATLAAMDSTEKIAWFAGVFGLSFFGIVGAAAGALGWRQAVAKLKIADRRNADLLREKHAALEQLEAANRFLPQRWLQLADKESRAGERDQGFKTLRTGYENVRRDIAITAFRLAEYHAERSGLREIEIGEACALAQVAALMAPELEGARTLAAELMETKASVAIETRRYDPNDVEWNATLDPVDSSEARPLIQRLVIQAGVTGNEGNVQMQMRLAQNALRMTRAAGLIRTSYEYVARYHIAAALMRTQRWEEALSEIDAYAANEAGASESPTLNVLATRRLRAEVLEKLGRSAEALTEIASFQQREIEILGADHERVRDTQTLRERVQGQNLS